MRYVLINREHRGIFPDVLIIKMLMRYRVKTVFQKNIFLLFSLFCFSAFSQSTNTAGSLDNNEAIWLLEQSSNNDVQNGNRGVTGNSNDVFVQQIGLDNYVSLVSSARTSDVKLSQEGNENSIYLSVDAARYLASIRQIGNNNRHLEFARASSMSLESSVLQQGQNNNLIIHGRNNLSDKIEVNMSGNDQTVIIRNFN